MRLAQRVGFGCPPGKPKPSVKSPQSATSMPVRRLKDCVLDRPTMRVYIERLVCLVCNSGVVAPVWFDPYGPARRFVPFFRAFDLNLRIYIK